MATRVERIPVPETLRRPHRFVAATRVAATGVTPDESGRLDVGRRPGVIYLHVSRAQLRRALLIAQALITEAERRGYAVEPIEKSYNHRAGCAIMIRGHSYSFEITELTNRRPLTEQELLRWRRDNRFRISYQPDLQPPQAHVPAGRLRLSLPDYRVKRANWSEGPRGPLERKLASVFAELERRADEDDRRDAERRQREEEWRRQQELRRERERLQRVEERRLERLRQETADRRLAAAAREYVVALRATLASLAEDDERRISGWCEWIEAWAERSDPTVNARRIVGLDDDYDGEELPFALSPRAAGGTPC